MDSDHMFHLNFAITLFNHGDLTEAGQDVAISIHVLRRERVTCGVSIWKSCTTCKSALFAWVCQARRQFVLFSDLFQQLDEEQRNSDPEAKQMHAVLAFAALRSAGQ